MLRTFHQHSRSKPIQTKPGAGEPERKGIARPSVAVLQPMKPVNKDSSSSAVLQLYTKEDIGHVSKNRKMILSGDELFAHDDKIMEANGLNGSIEFKRAGEGPEGLSKVEVLVRGGSDHHNNLKGYDCGENDLGKTRNELELGNIKEKTLNKFSDVDTLTIEYEGALEGYHEDNEPLPGDIDVTMLEGVDLAQSKNLRKLSKELAQITSEKIKLNGLPEIEIKIYKYLEQQVLFKHQPLMPSDCRLLATAIAGFNVGTHQDRDKVDLETEDIAAGHVYEITSDHKDTEWPYHYAAVIMTDDPDHVTMENAAAKASDKFSKPDYDRSWFFEMYGPEEDQTFTHKYGPLMNPDEKIGAGVFKKGTGLGHGLF
jgi:hypothetical protein